MSSDEGGPVARPLVYVLIVNWNRWATTLRCIELVMQSSYEPFRVLVIDNGSSDPAPAELPREVELLQAGGNLGFAGGNNLGLRHAFAGGADYVWILNNDAEPEADALARLVAAAESDPSWGALTSRILTAAGLEDTGLVGRLPAGERWDPVHRRFPELPIDTTGQQDGAVEIDLLRGPSFLMRADVLAQVGEFDETYFHYLEEMDLMERLVRAGWRLGFVRGSTVRHARGATLAYETPQSLYYLHRNHFRFEQKLFGTHPLRVVARHPLRRLRALLALRATLRGDFRPMAAQVRAFADAFRGRSGPVDLGTRYLEPLRRDGYES
jgi:GT2 family glycosyltransferase